MKSGFFKRIVVSVAIQLVLASSVCGQKYRNGTRLLKGAEVLSATPLQLDYVLEKLADTARIGVNIHEGKTHLVLNDGSGAWREWWYHMGKWKVKSHDETAVGLSMPGIFKVTGSPVTGSGTMQVILNGQNRNTVLAAPVNQTGIPVFRTLQESDIPNISWSRIINRPTTVSGYGITDAYTRTETRTIIGDTAGVLRKLIRIPAGSKPIEGSDHSILILKDGGPAAFSNASLTENQNTSRLNLRGQGTYLTSDGSILTGMAVSGNNQAYFQADNGYYGTRMHYQNQSRDMMAYMMVYGSGFMLQTTRMSNGQTRYVRLTPDSFRVTEKMGNDEIINLEYADDRLMVRDKLTIYQGPAESGSISAAADGLSFSTGSQTISLKEIIGKGQILVQATEPDLPDNSFAFWVSPGNFYLVLKSGNVQKKIQLQ